MAIAIILIRFWKLESLQNEVYGDIAIVYEYVREITEGNWPTHFSLSAGPLYHYLITPVVLIAGLNYSTLKISSALMSLLTIAVTYLFARRLIDKNFAILTSAITGLSSWFLIFSRLGNSQVIVPLLTVTSLWLLVRFVQDHRLLDLYLSLIVASLGLYTYPPAFPLSIVIVTTLVFLQLTKIRLRSINWRKVLVVFILAAIPFILIIQQNPSTLSSGSYIGRKFTLDRNTIVSLGANVLRAAGAYHIKGDGVARSNPQGLPHLDLVSGLLFFAGVFYWFGARRRHYGLLLLVPFLLLHLPSIAVTSAPQEVPSASRTLGVAPIAYLFVASGLWYLSDTIRKRSGRFASGVWSSLLFFLIISTNFFNYFQTYMASLPYRNTPVARLITSYLDLLPAETQIYMVGCCWEYGMPEPKSIVYEMAHPENLHLLDRNTLSCLTLKALEQPAVIIWSDKEDIPSPGLLDCAERLPRQLYSGPRGQPLFHAALILGTNSSPFRATQGSSAGESQLNVQSLTWQGRNVLARFSILDMGRIEDVIDGDFDTLMRGASANPLTIEFAFEEPVTAQAVRLTLAGGNHFSIRVVTQVRDATSTEFQKEFADLPPDPRIEIQLPELDGLMSLLIEVTDLRPKPAGGYHIHVREVELLGNK
jgi:hypothetical protein